MSTREIIDTGTLANDGTGDTFRSGGTKINNNFLRMWLWAGGDSNGLSTHISIDSDKIVFEGNLIDANNTSLKAVEPTAVNTVQIPNASGIIVLDTATQTLTNKILSTPTLDNPKINDATDAFTYNIVPAGTLAANRTLSLPVLTANDTFTFNAATQTLTNKTLTSPAITTPKITTSINDVNGAKMIGFTPIASAVLNWDITNAATTGNPILAATGTDSNVTAYINSKNRGAVRISKGAYQMATITAAGEVPQNRSYVSFNSGSGIAMTLANGLVSGEFKKLSNRGAGTVTITPASFANGTSFALAQNEACEVIWDGTSWFILANQSILTIT